MPEATSYQNLTDEELVALSLKDNSHYLHLMKRYEAKLTGYVRKITGFCVEDIEDIVQDVFIKAYRYLNGFDRKLKFSSWIYRIAHNESVSHFRKKRSRPNVISVEDNDLFLSQTLPSKENLEKEFEKRSQNVQINKVMEKLPRKYREILVLRYYEEKDYREISDILRKPMGTVATLLNRAKKAFKKEADKTGVTFNL